MSDSRGSIFHAVVEGMIEGRSLDREEVVQLLRSGYTYRMILKEAVNRRILDQDQYDDIADAALHQITDAAEILHLIRTNVIPSYAQGVEILVRNNTLSQDIVNALLEEGASSRYILEDLALVQRVRRNVSRGGGRASRGGGRTRRNSRKRRG